MPREPQLCHQTLALLAKNALLKWRRKWHSFLEWMQNLGFVFLMFFVTIIAENTSKNALSPALPLGGLDEFSHTNVTVGYVNTVPSARDIMQRLNRSVPRRGIKIHIQEYESDKDMLRDIITTTTIGVFFEDHLKYHIQYPINVLSSPNDYVTAHGLCNNVSLTSCIPTRYWHSGFLFLQASIDSAIIEMTTGESLKDTMTSIHAVRMRAPRYMRRQLMHTGIFIISMCMCYVSLTYLLSLYVSRERQQLREIMRVMKLKVLAFWLSWGLFYALYVFIVANLMTLVVKKFVFLESSYGVILLLFILYGLAMVSFTFMLSALFRNPRLTANVGFFLTLVLSLLSLLLLMKNLPKTVEVLLSVFPPFAFAVGLTESVHLENDLLGVFFLNMAHDSFHVLCSIVTLISDIILYMILTLYFDKVLPDRYGVRHGPLFFLKSSFWCHEKKTPQHSQSLRRDPECGDHIESVPSVLCDRNAIRILNVKKTYSGRDKKVEALRGLDFDIYEGQITALVGHSGAGKSTLLNILSGICRPTSGSATIYGCSPSDVTHSRVGFCPQFDVKFDPLTVKENLKVFAKIKGIAPGHVDTEVHKVISDLQMTDIQNMEAGILSGGQRRRLTLGIAILGDPQVLFLDEPTAGMDPCSRHQVWAVLKGRTMNTVTLLSTQFMDEADIVADWKAVISGGRLKCGGSSLFLKRKWGVGYHLKMQMTPSCDPETLTSVLWQHVSGATLSVKKDDQLTFTLPFQNMDTFPDLFSHLEERVGRDIVSFGVSMTTLDDVFLKLEGEAEIEQGDYGVFGHETTDEEDILGSEMEDSAQLMADSGNVTLAARPLWTQQTLAVARIRFLLLKHNMKSVRAILLLIGLYITLIMMCFTMLSSLNTIHTRELKGDLYFLRAGDKDHKYYSRLLICNNTGSPIADFTDAVTRQDIVIDVTDGPYNPNTTLYRGAIEVSGGKKGYSYSIMGSPRALNAFPVLLNIISNSQLKIFNSSRHIQTWSDPVTASHLDTLEMFQPAIFAMIFAAGMAPYLAMSSIKDTKIKARSQLHVSGLFPSAYWCGQALVDIPFYWILLFLMTAVLFIFNHQIVLDLRVACVLIFHILGYGAAVILYVYVIAFIVRNQKSHQDWWSFFFILTSSVHNIFLDLFTFYSPWNSILWPFMFPASALPLLLQEIVFIESMKRDSPNTEESDDLLPILIISYVQIFLFFGILWCLEYKFGTQSLHTDPLFRTSKRKIPAKLKPQEPDDADEAVLAEIERVKLARSGNPQDEKPPVIVDRLRKEFKVKSGACGCRKTKTIVATKSLSLCVQRGEVLGLLGPNGAGKSTSILMLAGELKPSAGEVELCDAPGAALGYCCQDNPLWQDLTVQQHLEIYAAIKGMKKEDGDPAIQRIAKALELSDHMDKVARKLSAGVSRKVCFAISMLGNPSVVLLDEPSTGLDPKGRQRVWRAIRAAFRNKDRGAILTTHYMEEAEAVCDRIAIMVSGKLRCIGSIQQLKTTFGKDYVLEMKVKDSQHALLLHRHVIQTFPQAARQERFSSLLVYKIPKEDVHSLSWAFSQLEEAKRVFDVDEYSFSQCTLEQVFLDLVKEQEKDDFGVEKAFSWKRLQSESL